MPLVVTSVHCFCVCCVVIGLQSGFVTLPRLSRLDRQFLQGDVQKEPLTDSDSFTLTRSDSLASFTVDLGPSLMSEVLSLIDNPGCFQMSNHSQETEEEAADEGEEGEENSSLTETRVPSPEATLPDSSMSSRGRSHSSNATGQEVKRSARTPDASVGSPQRVEPVMEAEQFQRAADVLSRHYGGGSFTKAKRTSNNAAPSPFSYSRKSPYRFSEEEEEEIKV